MIFAAVGVLKGRRLMGGNLSGWSPFLPTAGTGFDLTSVLDTSDDLREDGSRSLGVSSVAMASTSDSTVGLPLIGVSTCGKLEERAEKNGCSISLRGDSNALGIAGTGGTSSFPLEVVVSSRGFGVGRRDDEMTPGGSRGSGPVEFLTEL